MWLKTRKTNALLAPLVQLIGGEVTDGRLRGSYRAYAVEAFPHSGYPITYLPSDTASQPKPVNMLRVTLSGVAGIKVWHCQSSASSYLQDIASRFTAGPLLERFKPGEFKFAGADTLNDSLERMGEKLVKRLGMPIKANADPALQERLIEAGVFDELDALRFGAHPYLPRVQFMPGARALAGQMSFLARAQPAIEERLRAVGMPDYESLIEAKMREAEEKDPGRLELEVEAGQDRVPSVAQFGELLEHAVRIAQINAEVNDA